MDDETDFDQASELQVRASYYYSHNRMAEIAGVDIAGVDSDGVYRMGVDNAGVENVGISLRAQKCSKDFVDGGDFTEPC